MDTPDSTPTKACSKCGKSLPATTEYFALNDRLKSGLRANCRECSRAAWRAYDASHREERRQKALARYHADPQKFIAKTKEHAKNHPELAKARKRRNQLKHPDKHLERCKRYYQSHKKEVAAATSVRRARLLAASGKYTNDDVKLQLKSQCDKCWHCGKLLDNGYEIDHLIPLSRGGSNEPENIVISCRHCNRSKNNKLPQEWNGRLF